MKKQHIMLALLVLLGIILFQRFNSSSLLLGDEAYYHLMVAEKIHSDPSLLADNLYLREFHATPFDVLLAVHPAAFLAQLLNTLFAVLSLTAFYFLLQELSPENHSYGTLLLASSPLFLYLAAFPGAEAMAVFITLLSINLYLKQKYLSSAATAFFLSFFSPFNTFLLLALFLLQQKKTREEKKVLPYLVLNSLIATMIHPEFYHQLQPRGLFADFGSYAGLSIIMLLFAFAGMLSTWKKTKWATLLFFTAFLLSFMFSDLNIYVNFYIAALAGTSLHDIIRRDWEDNSLKTIAFFLIFSSFLLSSLSYVNFTKSAPPSQEVYEALSYLSGLHPEGEVLSREDKSMLIAYFGMQPFIPLVEREEALAAAEEVFLSRNLANTRRVFETNNIRYVLLQRNVDLGKFEETRGLRFLLGNKEAFTQVYEGDAELWRYEKLN